jgi:FlaA1/EpsC-like NDP-sugar epimerase
MPTSRVHDVPEGLDELLSFLSFWAVLFGLFVIVAMIVVTILAVSLLPIAILLFAMLSILCVRLIRAVFYLAMNHPPWFLVLVLTAYIITTRVSTSAKQETRHQTPPKRESRHKTLDEIMVGLQKNGVKTVRETRQALNLSEVEVMDPTQKTLSQDADEIWLSA